MTDKDVVILFESLMRAGWIGKITVILMWVFGVLMIALVATEIAFLVTVIQHRLVKP